MSSLEIAELTGKRHDNVLSDIRKMLEELGKRSADFSADVPDSYGRSRFVFNLPKRETMILVSGYSIQLRARMPPPPRPPVSTRPWPTPRPS